MSPRSASLPLKRALLAFWALWFLVVFTTNVMDVLRISGLLNTNWPAVSDNYFLISKTTSVYRLPARWNTFFFFSIMSWQAICVIVFLQACIKLGKDAAGECVYRAFGFGIGLFAAFILACEVFINYELEAVHMRVFTAQLASLLAVRLLPD